MFYEHPDISFSGMKQKFFDIRKRAYHFPELGKKAKLVCIPTTSGTGSEVTSFAVITDKKNNIKYPLADYELTPDVAIVDPQFVMSVPKAVTADTGMDVLTHAIEAYVSVLASDYTDGLALHAIRMVYKYLKRAYDNGADKEARERMHNASCIAGMAFTNAFLGINHSLAHKLGSAYHIPHGRANAILLPYVIAYNAQRPTKFATWPKYEHFIADKRYAEIAEALGLPCSTTEEGVQSLIKAITDLQDSMNVPRSIQSQGIAEKVFMENLDEVADEAHADQCTPANPRYPLISELKEILLQAYYGPEGKLGGLLQVQDDLPGGGKGLAGVFLIHMADRAGEALLPQVEGKDGGKAGGHREQHQVADAVDPRLEELHRPILALDPQALHRRDKGNRTAPKGDCEGIRLVKHSELGRASSTAPRSGRSHWPRFPLGTAFPCRARLSLGTTFPRRARLSLGTTFPCRARFSLGTTFPRRARFSLGTLFTRRASVSGGSHQTHGSHRPSFTLGTGKPHRPRLSRLPLGARASHPALWSGRPHPALGTHRPAGSGRAGGTAGIILTVHKETPLSLL